MKKLLRLLVVGGLLLILTQYLKGDTAAGAWHDLGDTASGR